MKFIKPILIALVLHIAALFAPLLMLLALPFIRWDAVPSTDRYGRDVAIRGDLPSWLAWLATPDERLPGGLYEPTVKAVLSRFGRVLDALGSWRLIVLTELGPGAGGRRHGLLSNRHLAQWCEL